MKKRILPEMANMVLLTFSITVFVVLISKSSYALFATLLLELGIVSFLALIFILLGRNGVLEGNAMERCARSIFALLASSMYFSSIAIFAESQGMEDEVSVFLMGALSLLFALAFLLKMGDGRGRSLLFVSTIILVSYPVISLTLYLFEKIDLASFIVGAFISGVAYTSLYQLVSFALIIEDTLLFPVRLLVLTLLIALLSALLLFSILFAKSEEENTSSVSANDSSMVLAIEESDGTPLGILVDEGNEKEDDASLSFPLHIEDDASTEEDVEPFPSDEKISDDGKNVMDAEEDVPSAFDNVPSDEARARLMTEASPSVEEVTVPLSDKERKIEEYIKADEKEVPTEVSLSEDPVNVTEDDSDASEEAFMEEVGKDGEGTVHVPQVPSRPMISVTSSISEVFPINDETLPSESAENVIEDASSIAEDGHDTEDEVEYYHDAIYDDDYFADFFVQGEDSFTLYDGLYFMALVINGDAVGQISVEIREGEAYLSSQELKEYLDGNITDEAYDRIFLGKGDEIALSPLNDIGIETSYDSSLYEVYLNFSTEDMPVRMLSLRGSSGISRRPIMGAVELEPATFTLATRFNLSSYASVNDWDTFKNTLRFTLSAYNNVRIGKVKGNFSWYMDWDLDSFDFRLGSYEFYTDFEDEMIRLSWGNVDTELLSPSGTPFGIRFDKALEYAAPGVRGKSHLERVISIEKQSDVTIYNEGREIFRRTLDPGNYRLSDFILYTGANRIRIEIRPLDGTEMDIIEFDVNYSSSLLAPGEIYFGASLTTGRKRVSSASDMVPGAFRIPLWYGRSWEYDFRNLVLSGYVTAGITEDFTMDVSAAVQNEVESSDVLFNPSAVLAFEFTHANAIGTTRYNLRVTEHGNAGAFTLPEIYARIGHQVYTSWTPISSFTIAATYDGDFVRHSLSLSTSLSGSFNILGWGLSGYVGSYLDDFDSFYYNISNTYSLALGRYMYLSASIDLNGDAYGAPEVSGRVYATFRFGNGNAGLSYSSSGYSYAEVGYHDSNNGLTVRLDNPNEFANINSYGLSADYTYSGKYANATVGMDASDLFGRTTMNASISTSTLFADGLFTMASSIPSNFILVEQKGALKGNELSVGRAGSSSSDTIPSVFGSHLYTGLPVGSTGYVSLYSTERDGFSMGSSYDIAIPASHITGYVLRLDKEETYSLSGVVEIDGELWLNGSSPLYRAIGEDDGKLVLEEMDNYIFSDRDGRFIVSDLESGDYAFDVRIGSDWYLVRFTVPENEDYADGIIILSTLAMDNSSDIEIPYSAYLVYEDMTCISNDAFWNMLYPELEIGA